MAVEVDVEAHPGFIGVRDGGRFDPQCPIPSEQGRQFQILQTRQGHQPSGIDQAKTVILIEPATGGIHLPTSITFRRMIFGIDDLATIGQQMLGPAAVQFGAKLFGQGQRAGHHGRRAGGAAEGVGVVGIGEEVATEIVVAMATGNVGGQQSRVAISAGSGRRGHDDAGAVVAVIGMMTLGTDRGHGNDFGNGVGSGAGVTPGETAIVETLAVARRHDMDHAVGGGFPQGGDARTPLRIWIRRTVAVILDVDFSITKINRVHEAINRRDHAAQFRRIAEFRRRKGIGERDAQAGDGRIRSDTGHAQAIAAPSRRDPGDRRTMRIVTGAGKKIR